MAVIGPALDEDPEGVIPNTDAFVPVDEPDATLLSIAVALNASPPSNSLDEDEDDIV
jgi:hypothetical protein